MQIRTPADIVPAYYKGGKNIKNATERIDPVILIDGRGLLNFQRIGLYVRPNLTTVNGGKRVDIKLRGGKLHNLEKMKKPFRPLANKILGYYGVDDIVLLDGAMPHLSLIAVNMGSRSVWREPMRREVLFEVGKILYPGKNVHVSTVPGGLRDHLPRCGSYVKPI